jgi:hypothetical protein
MAAAVPWVPALTVSLMDGGRRIRNIKRKRLLSFQKVERLGRVIIDIKGIRNVHKDLLGQAGKGVRIFKFL